MKTKNMRKKALVSSMAMLLVAVVALSGATYAWFAANSSANATGLNFKTETSSTLLFAVPENSAAVTTAIATENNGINSADDYYAVNTNWTTSYTLYTAPTGQSGIDNADRKLLTPYSAGLTSAGALTTFVATNGLEVVGGDETATKVTSFAGINGSNGIYTESFCVKNTTSMDLYLTTIQSPTNSNFLGALRMAVTVSDGTTTGRTQIFAFAPAAQDGEGHDITRYCITAAPGSIAAGSEPTFAQLYAGNNNGVSGLTVVEQPISTPGMTANETKLFSLTGGQRATVTLTFWLEGNDARCNSSAMNATLDGFTFTFGVKDAA